MACPESARVWNEVFSGRYALPKNGPGTEKGFCRFIIHSGRSWPVGVDQYQSGLEMIDEAWLDQILRENKNPFVFVYGHEPAFMDGHHVDTLDAHSDLRDSVWETLIHAGARVYFCGHDHFYDHMKITRATGDTGPEMHQFTAGAAGAPFYQGGPYQGQNSYWKLTQLKHIDNTYGYILVTIKGPKATITFKGRTAPDHYEAMDTFSYTVGQPTSSELRLLRYDSKRIPALQPDTSFAHRVRAKTRRACRHFNRHSRTPWTLKISRFSNVRN